METKSWTTFDKSDWGDGPWQDEPDKMQWTDEATGLPCLIVRAQLTGALCGYVGVDANHPWYRADPSDISHGVSVHGDLNFGDHCQEGAEERGVCHTPGPGEPDNVWWLGFDCSHAWDISPGNKALCRQHGIAPYSSLLPGDPVYRDLDYVRDQCRRLARQIHERTAP